MSTEPVVAADPQFIEIRSHSSQHQSQPNKWIQVLTSRVEARHCGPLLKELVVSPKSEALSHLKRVKNEGHHTKQAGGDESNTKMRKVELKVLLGEEDFVVPPELAEKYNLCVETTTVPGRPAQSREELDEFNMIWPTIYFHKKSEEHKAQELALTDEEIKQMVFGMKQAIEHEAVILNPVTGIVVSKAPDESLLQSKQTGSENVFTLNPLATPTLLAVQGVSRQERLVASGHGMNSDEFRKGQYLCTGYDIYLREEPSVFEAMALVHSRIRRVVFGTKNERDGGIGGTGEASAVHCLPGTNHRYRAFVCAPSSDLANACRTACSEE